MLRRHLLAALLLCGLSPWGAQAQTAWPIQPIKLINPFPTGGTVDQITRLLQPHLQQALGQAIVVENKVGASGSIGTGIVAKAPADGYNWVMVFDTHGVNPSLYPNLPFDTLKDLRGVMQIGTGAMVITAHSSTPYKSYADLVAAAREAGDAGFDVLIACAFNYDAHSAEFDNLGRIPVLKARMNADLHMADDLKNTGKGNLFVIFGEPDITLLPEKDGKLRVKVNGVDVFKPQTGEVTSHGADGIACWFIDTDYNEESFFVRHAYFLGANDPYSALKTTLKAEINAEAWATLHSDTSRPFEKPKGGRIAVKVINHLGDEVMKVFEVR